MDPNACLALMLDHFNDGIKNDDIDELDECLYCAKELIGWIERGGFVSGDIRDMLGCARVIHKIALARKQILGG